MTPASRGRISRPGLGRADLPHELEPARQEDDGPEEGHRGQDGRRDGDRVVAVAEELEGHDGLRRASLDEQEDAPTTAAMRR